MTESYFQYGTNNPEGNEGCSLLVWSISSALQKAEQRQSLPPPVPSKQKLWFTWGDHIKPEQRHASGMYLIIPLCSRDTRETTSHCVVSALSNNLHPLLKHPTLPDPAGWQALSILLTLVPCCWGGDAAATTQPTSLPTCRSFHQTVMLLLRDECSPGKQHLNKTGAPALQKPVLLHLAQRGQRLKSTENIPGFHCLDHNCLALLKLRSHSLWALVSLTAKLGSCPFWDSQGYFKEQAEVRLIRRWLVHLQNAVEEKIYEGKKTVWKKLKIKSCIKNI